jgi:hypothetical protein
LALALLSAGRFAQRHPHLGTKVGWKTMKDLELSRAHLIAVGREAMGANKHGRRLPDEKQETRQAAAVYAAYAARQEYFASCADSQKDKATWVVQGRRLDPVSEQKLRKSEEANLEKLERELSLTTRLREGK